MKLCYWGDLVLFLFLFSLIYFTFSVGILSFSSSYISIRLFILSTIIHPLNRIFLVISFMIEGHAIQPYFSLFSLFLSVGISKKKGKPDTLFRIFVWGYYARHGADFFFLDCSRIYVSRLSRSCARTPQMLFY